MATPIMPKHNNTSGTVPTPANLVTNELAINTADGIAFVKHSDGTIKQIVDPSKAPLNSPSLTGIPTAPTANPNTSTTQLATTEFVTKADNLKANIASPEFTGTPTAPTADAGTTTTQIATTEFVTKADNYIFNQLDSKKADKSYVNSFVSNIDALITQQITYITKSGYNSIAMLIGGKLYTTSGNSSSYPNATTGRGLSGQLGQFGFDNLKRVYIPENSPIKKVGGFVHTFAYALLENGNLYTWGNNTNGQCGLGHTNPVAMPTLAATDVVDAYDHPSNSGYDIDKNRLFIKKTDGYVYGTGDNSYGALGLGDTNNRNTFTQITSLGTDVVNLWNMGADLGCAIAQKSDYTIWAAGHNGYGQLGTGDTNHRTSFVDVTEAWGGAGKLLKKVIGGFGVYIPSTAYQSATIGMLFDDGTSTTFKTCGSNNAWQLGTNSISGNTSTPYTPNVGTGRIVDIAAVGGWPTVQALKEDGTLYVFGYNEYGQAGIGNGSGIPSPVIAATGVTALLSDGVNNHYYGYATQVAILKPDGVYMSGLNDDCYCGIGKTPGIINTFTKTMLPSDFTVKLFGTFITASYGRICVAVSTDYRIYVWGYNGQYGVYNGNGPNVSVPVNINIPKG